VKVVLKGQRAPKPAMMPGAEGVSTCRLIGADEGSPIAAMRLFEIVPGGKTPWHTHDWEHVIYGVEGQGILKTEHGDAAFGPGDSLLVEPNEQHNFVNTGKSILRFTCVVPLRGDV
jgi:quercetin dioxygenase-like cupin family protein